MKTKLKRISLIFLAVVLVAVICCACGGSSYSASLNDASISVQGPKGLKKDTTFSSDTDTSTVAYYTSEGGNTLTLAINEYDNANSLDFSFEFTKAFYEANDDYSEEEYTKGDFKGYVMTYSLYGTRFAALLVHNDTYVYQATLYCSDDSISPDDAVNYVENAKLE